MRVKAAVFPLLVLYLFLLSVLLGVFLGGAPVRAQVVAASIGPRAPASAPAAPRG
jgi:hypothetical protein